MAVCESGGDLVFEWSVVDVESRCRFSMLRNPILSMMLDMYDFQVNTDEMIAMFEAQR